MIWLAVALYLMPSVLLVLIRARAGYARELATIWTAPKMRPRRSTSSGARAPQ